MTKDKKNYLILTINPGSTSTKIGVFKNEESIFETTVMHSVKLLEEYDKIWNQYSFRKHEIIEELERNNISLKDLDVVVGRGGLFKPIESGVYVVDENMIEDARIGVQGEHASNLGCVIAYGIGWEFNIPAYITNPPSVDELEDVARVSGNKNIERNSIFHALNVFSTARIYAKDIKKDLKDLNLIVAHLGGGITVTALQKGRAINVNNGLDEGPFSPQRSGKLPLFKLVDLAYSNKLTKKELKKMLVGNGGFASYFGTNDAREIEKLASEGSPEHKIIFEAMAYQIAEEIGSRATNLKGNVDSIILTGGLAYSKLLVSLITERVEFISNVSIYAGENELKALAMGGLRVLKGETDPKKY
jgi:butyrate kinase